VASSKRRRFEVSGIDENGEVHLFRTDDRERAEDIRRQMAEDLEEVELQENL
jgi:hypothetical protein